MRNRYRLIGKIPTNITIVILLGTFVVCFLLISLLCVSYFILEHSYVLPRIVVGLLVLAYLSIATIFASKNDIKVVAWMLISLYTLIAIFILHSWGINAPVGILMFGFIIALSGIMLGAKYIVWVTFGTVLILVLLQIMTHTGTHQPNRTMLDNSSTFGDVASYSILFSIFALIAWLSGRQMERMLRRALRAEYELQKEKDSLAFRLEIQNQNLREAQIKEMKQLYKFAELGQLTTVILHELANYLSILTLDIDDIKERHQSSLAVTHAKESITYIDSIIEKVRSQIKDSDAVKKFNVASLLEQTHDQLMKKHPDASITLTIQNKSKFANNKVFGDPLRLAQAIVILVTNAYQARIENEVARIDIEAKVMQSTVQIIVKDYGQGVPERIRLKLFEPHKSLKGDGLGIGLYITKQIIETHFKGKISLSNSVDTRFNIELPKSH